MTLETVHDYLEGKCPDGAGFALHYRIVDRLLQQAVAAIAVDPQLHTCLPLFATNAVQFSFYIDPASVSLTPDWKVSLKLDVVLHVTGDPTAEIVRVTYEVDHVSLTGEYDRTRGQCFWKPASPSAPSKTGELWEATGTNLIKAGFVDGNGAADRQSFLDQFYYGFVWINSAQLLPTILRAVPFPQIQHYLGPIRLSGLLEMEIVDEHLAVWSNEVDIIDVHCGGGTIAKPAVKTDWAAAGVGTPKSPWDNREPDLGLYLGATTLLDWHAGYLAPAIAIHQSGGGFVRYDLDGALSLQSLKLTLQIDPNGGSLTLDAGLRLLALADSYMDGPCGSRLSLASATLTGDAYAKATVGVHIESKALVLDLDIQADVDKGSVNISSGGLLGGIFGEIVEILYKSGILRIDTAFRQRSRVDLLDLSDLAPNYSKSGQRVSDMSVFYPVVLNDG